MSLTLRQIVLVPLHTKTMTDSELTIDQLQAISGGGREERQARRQARAEAREQRRQERRGPRDKDDSVPLPNPSTYCDSWEVPRGCIDPCDHMPY